MLRDGLDVRRLMGNASGAVADLGVMIPIAAALVIRNGFDPGTILVGAGALYVVAGLLFRVPVPVQPIKAAAAIALARDLDPAVLSVAGIILGVVLLILGITGASNYVTRIFSTPIVRGLQLGVGLILLDTALQLIESQSELLVVTAIAAALLVGARRVPVALIVVAGGVAYSLIQGSTVDPQLGIWEPGAIGRLDVATFASALVLLVVPQLPLTFGNAVAAVVDLERKFFGERAKRVTPRAVSISCGLANVAVGSLGGMPMCHGSNGLTAHHRAGARTYAMNIMIGMSLLALGLFAGSFAFDVLALIPMSVLAGLLAFTGLNHGALVLDQRGFELGVSVAMGIIGFATSNLALALGLGLALYWGHRAIFSLRPVSVGRPD